MVLHRNVRRLGLGAAVWMVLACAGLEADVAGTHVSVGGQPWPVELCESGAVYGFEGIQLQGSDGRRLRIVTQADGTAEVVLFDVGAPTGTSFGNCATAAFTTTGLTVNDIVALQGAATLTCTGEPTVDGAVQVDRCATPLF